MNTTDESLNSINPFDAETSIKPYLQSGGNPNVEQDGIPLILYMLKNKTYQNKAIENTIALMCHPETKTYTEEIQAAFMIEWISLRDQTLKTLYASEPDFDFKNYILKFDLISPVFCSRDGYGENRDYKTYWVHYFLCSQSTFPLFWEAHDFHPNFKDCLMLKNTDGLTPLCGYSHYIVNNQINSNPSEEGKQFVEELSDYTNPYAISDALIELCPEALFEKNRLDLNPAETAEHFKFSSIHLKEETPQFINYITYIKKITQFFQLQRDLPITEQQFKKSKI
jgi:hypothetical protein